MVDFSRFVPQAPQAPAVANLRPLADLLSRPRLEAEDKRRFDEQSSRSNAFLKLQQDAQARRFSKEDQAEVEGLMAELQQAQDQGDPVVHARALEKLRRFGFDVGKLSAFTGDVAPSAAQKPLPLSTQRFDPRAREFTGATEPGAALLPSQDAPELSQGDFEEQLISETANMPERYEATAEEGKGEPGTTPEFRKRIEEMIGGTPEGGAPEDYEDPPAVPLGQVDFDIDSEEAKLGNKTKPSQLTTQGLPSGQSAPDVPGRTAAASPARPLSTQAGGNIISKGGVVVATDSGPSGRWQSTVASAFEPFLQQENPKLADAAKRAQSLAMQLIRNDGISPKDAVQFAFQRYENEVQNINNLERTMIGSNSKRPRGGAGGGGGFKAMSRKEDTAESIKSYISEGRSQLSKLTDSDRLLAQAEALANSPDPALQRNAIDVLVQSRSGATVAVSERARYDQMDGVLAQAKNYVSRWTGGPLDPSYVEKIKQVIATQRSINANTREEIAADLEEAYAAQNEGKVDPSILERRRKALGKTIRRTEGSVDPNADLYE